MTGKIVSVYVNGNPVSRGGKVTVPKNKKWELRVRVKLEERHLYTGVEVYYGTKKERVERTGPAYKEYWVKWDDMAPILGATPITIKLYARNLRSHYLDSFSFLLVPFETKAQKGVYRSPSSSTVPTTTRVFGGFNENVEVGPEATKKYIVYGVGGLAALGGIIYLARKLRRIH